MPKKEECVLSPNFIDILLNRRKEVKKILENEEKEKYYESIIIQYSLIESTLKYMVFLQLSYNLAALHTNKKTSYEDFSFKMEKLKVYCQGLSFYQALHLAISSNVIDEKLYKQIESIRNERNDWIHQCWLLQYKSNSSKLKQELTIVNSAFWDLTITFGDLLVDFKRPELIAKLIDLHLFFVKTPKKVQKKKIK